jgi:ParB-like chromosome segregation protein Spo0J
MSAKEEDSAIGEVTLVNARVETNRLEHNRTSPEEESGGAALPELVMVPLSSLVLDDSPRLGGENASHTRTLAEADADLPPILVHRSTMRVLDGLHRVQAARLKGAVRISARYFDGDAREAFVKAVEANISHGLPLSLSDRKAAAKRVIASYPEWSDRAVATATGLSAKTIGRIRSRSSDASTQSNTRVGKDGRSRPLDAAEGRARAAALIAERPAATLREIARSAGVSLGTAYDVRRRLDGGAELVPPGARNSRTAGSKPERGEANHPRAPINGQRVTGDAPNGVPSSLLKGLKRDPSLRYSESGRNILAWLDARVMDPADWSRVINSVPPHCLYVIADIAMGCAQAWEELAQQALAQVPHTARGGGTRRRPRPAPTTPAGSAELGNESPASAGPSNGVPVAGAGSHDRVPPSPDDHRHRCQFQVSPDHVCTAES